jgi:hypothetical protein
LANDLQIKKIKESNMFNQFNNPYGGQFQQQGMRQQRQGFGQPAQPNIYQQYRQPMYGQPNMYQQPMQSQQMNMQQPMYGQPQPSPAFQQQMMNRQPNMYQQPMYGQPNMYQQPMQQRMPNTAFGYNPRIPNTQPVAGPMSYTSNVQPQQPAMQQNQPYVPQQYQNTCQQFAQPAAQEQPMQQSKKDVSTYKPEPGNEFPLLYDEDNEILEIVFDDVRQTYKFVVKNK